MAYQVYDGYVVWEDDHTERNWDTVRTPTGGSNREFWTMDASLIQRRRVGDEGFRIVNPFYLLVILNDRWISSS